MTDQPRYYYHPELSARYFGTPLDGIVNERCGTCGHQLTRWEYAMGGLCMLCQYKQRVGPPVVLPERGERQREDEESSWLVSLGVPRRYAGYSPENWPDAKGPFPALATEWDGANRWCLYLWGPTGTAKTHLAVAVMRLWRRAKRGTVGWTGAREVAERLKEAEWTGNLREALRVHVEAPSLLVIDDLWLDRLPEALRSWAMMAMATRYERWAATVVTGHDSPEDIARVDARVASRLGGNEAEVRQVLGEDGRLG